MPKQNIKYDLAERTGLFGKDVMLFAKKIPDNSINRSLISQFVRSGTSIGANYSDFGFDLALEIGILKLYYP